MQLADESSEAHVHTYVIVFDQCLFLHKITSFSDVRLCRPKMTNQIARALVYMRKTEAASA